MGQWSEFEVHSGTFLLYVSVTLLAVSSKTFTNANLLVAVFPISCSLNASCSWNDSEQIYLQSECSSECSTSVSLHWRNFIHSICGTRSVMLVLAGLIRVFEQSPYCHYFLPAPWTLRYLSHRASAIWPLPNYTAPRERQCVNNLPRVITWKWNNGESNPCLLICASNTLTITRENYSQSLLN